MNKSEENKNENKNQHYVPRYYFRFFSLDEISICMLLRKNGRVVFPTAIGKQSSGDYFYGDKNVEGEITFYDTKYLINHNNIIDYLQEGRSGEISNNCISTLIENILFQRERTMAYRDSETMVREFYNDFFEPQIEDLKDYDSGHSKEATEAVQEAIEKALKALGDQKITQYVNLMQIEKRKNEISDLRVIFLRNKTKLPFIFSDSPVAYSNFALRDYKCSKVNEINLGLQIFFPLTSSWLAFLYDPEAYQINGNMEGTIVDVFTEKDVDEINRLQIHESFNSVYFENSEFKDYLEKLWKEENPTPERDRKSLEKLPEITLDGFITGRTIFSVCEPEPVFHPNLSFLSLNDISETHIPYRSTHIKSSFPNGAFSVNLNHLVDRFSDKEK